eukprot:261039-Rhodomonas_salina.1
MRMRKEVAEMEEVVVVGMQVIPQALHFILPFLLSCRSCLLMEAMQVKQQAAAQDASDDGGAEALFLVSQLP